MARRELPTYDELQALRQLAPLRADWHLANWGTWCNTDIVTVGYDSKSAGLDCGGISGEDAFEHLCEPIDEWSAEVCDAIIDDLPQLYRLVLINVYAAGVMSFRPGMMEKVLPVAAAEFWEKAQRKDLA